MASTSCTFSLFVLESYVISPPKVATSAPAVSIFAWLDIAFVDDTEEPSTALVTCTVVCKLCVAPWVVVAS